MFTGLRKKFTLSYSVVAVTIPLFVYVALNAVLRPWLAEILGGVLVRSGSTVRGSNRWWSFKEATQVEHRVLTWFLSCSDGAIAMITFGLIALLLITGWITGRLGSRS